jgi:PBP1b-binding outer membrane lipoprotein LpoB
MKNLAWVLALALLLCACRKDKDEDYDSVAETDRIQMEDYTLIG